MLNFNKHKHIEPKISKYIKEQTNKSLEKYLNKQYIAFNDVKAYNINAYNLFHILR
jgi:hypothetical protein